MVEQLKITLLGEAPQVRQTDPEAYALYLQARQAHHQVTASSYQRAVILYQQALAVDPGYAAAWRNLAAVYLNQVVGGLRSPDEGYRLVRESADKALSSDRMYAPAHDLIGSYRTVLRLRPDSASSRYLIGVALLLGGKPEAALVEMQQEPSIWREIGLPMVYHQLQQPERSDIALAGLIEKLEQDGAINIAQVLAYRGETDRAFVWLDKAVASNELGLSDISTALEFNNLHDDPRWKLILESIGMSPEQLAAIEFRVTLPGSL